MKSLPVPRSEEKIYALINYMRVSAWVVKYGNSVVYNSVINNTDMH